MEKKTRSRKLTLHRETLRQLDEASLRPVAGGATANCPPTLFTCPTTTDTATATTTLGFSCLC